MIAVQDGEAVSEGTRNLWCLLAEIDLASPDIVHICIYKGAKLNSSRWYWRSLVLET